MLPRLDRLGHALADDHNFQNVLALVYSDIIEFHRRAYKFVRQRCKFSQQLHGTSFSPSQHGPSFLGPCGLVSNLDSMKYRKALPTIAIWPIRRLLRRILLKLSGAAKLMTRGGSGKRTSGTLLVYADSLQV